MNSVELVDWTCELIAGVFLCGSMCVLFVWVYLLTFLLS